MTFSSFGVVYILLCSVVVNGQSLPDSVLIARLKANQEIFPEWKHGPNLVNMALKLGHDVKYEPIVKETSIVCQGCPPPDNLNHPEFRKATSLSDLVVVGKIVRNISSLNDNQTFVFTDSELLVEQVWKNGDSANSPKISVGEEITVASPGGLTRSHGFAIKAIPSNLRPPKIGARYLLYLKYLPASQSYVSIGLDGFELEDLQVLPVKTTLTWPGNQLFDRPLDFLNAAHSSTERAISEGGR